MIRGQGEQPVRKGRQVSGPIAAAMAMLLIAPVVAIGAVSAAGDDPPPQTKELHLSSNARDLASVSEGLSPNLAPDSAPATAVGLEELTLTPAEAAQAFGATDPAAEALRRTRTPADQAPAPNEIRAALALIESALSERGAIGGAIFWPGWGFGYRGTAPGFQTWVDVDVYPSIDGSLELIARRELAAYSMVEEDLPPDTPAGRVWLGEGVAYGHNSGDDPDEWVALEIGSELFLVRVFHSGGLENLIGPDAFLPLALDLVEVLREVGMARDTLASSPAFQTDPLLGQKMLVALVTDCEDICGPVSTRGPDR